AGIATWLLRLRGGGENPGRAVGDLERVLVETVALVQLERADHPGAQLHVVVVRLDAAAYAVDDGLQVTEPAHVGVGPAKRECFVPSGGRALPPRPRHDHTRDS